MKPPIVVIGSSNTDMVIKADRLPGPGETILGGTFFMNAGGKGANQAVAAARLGGNVHLIAKTGNDIFGQQAVQLFKEEGINTAHVSTESSNPSGIALINVDAKGENCIVVAPGANAALATADLGGAIDIIQKAAVILMQVETPLEVIEYIVSLKHATNRIVILNPAPVRTLRDELLKGISIITPNELEAEMLTGIKIHNFTSAQKAAKILYDKGIPTIVITLGAKGAVILHDKEFSSVKAPVVEAVDTTAAGDVFNGALAVGLSERMNIQKAVSFACKAAAVSITRLGAQSSAPYRKEIND